MALPLLDDVRRRRQAIQGVASEPLSLGVVYASMSVRVGQVQSGLDFAQATAGRARPAGNKYRYNVAIGTVCVAYLEEARAEMQLSKFPEAQAEPLLARAVRCLTNGLGPEHRLTREAIDLQNKMAASHA